MYSRLTIQRGLDTTVSGPRSSFFLDPLDRQARTGETVLVKSRERTQTYTYRSILKHHRKEHRGQSEWGYE
jgi:hypothetical protein